MLNYINKTPLEDAHCIVGYYSLGLQQLVQPNSTTKRTAFQSGITTRRQVKQVQTLQQLHAAKKLGDPVLWPRVPFYGFDIDLLDMHDNSDYLPTRLESQHQHANAFPYNVLKHQLWFMSRHLSDMRNRRRAIIENKYDSCRPFFVDAYDRAQYFNQDRPDEWRHLADEQYREQLRNAHDTKQRKLVKVRHEKSMRMLRGERIEHMDMGLPLDCNQLMILVDVVDLYHGSGNLADFQLNPTNVLPTVHNAMALYLSIATARHNELMANVLPYALNDSLGNVSVELDINTRVCSLIHPSLDLHWLNGPMASKRMGTQRPPSRDRMNDQVILPWRETHQAQAALLERAAPTLTRHIPRCNFQLTDHLLHAKQESKRQHKTRLARRQQLRDTTDD